jgi:hypothetical protein
VPRLHAERIYIGISTSQTLSSGAFWTKLVSEFCLLRCIQMCFENLWFRDFTKQIEGACTSIIKLKVICSLVVRCSVPQIPRKNTPNLHIVALNTLELIWKEEENTWFMGLNTALHKRFNNDISNSGSTPPSSRDGSQRRRDSAENVPYIC